MFFLASIVPKLYRLSVRDSCKSLEFLELRTGCRRQLSAQKSTDDFGIGGGCLSN
jgi:hypothetical protein